MAGQADRGALLAEGLRLYRRGRELMDEKKPAEALAQFRESLSMAVHFKTLELAGECALNLGANRDAIVLLAAASALGNKAFRAKYLLAQALWNEEEREDAIAQLRLALVDKSD